MNILVLYNSTQTYTNTVFEHLESFSKHSCHEYYFQHYDASASHPLNLDYFDALIIHYSIRLPFDQISIKTADQLAHFKGIKALFIQDEYDNTLRTWYWIKQIKLDIVFTVVPKESIDKIYPPSEFPGVKFVNVLTGYVSEKIAHSIPSNTPTSKRKIVIGYRARELPIRYGQLGIEKVAIAKFVKEYCKKNNIRHDIDWTEKSRIYGEKWYTFIASCKAMLGTESGSNVFNWDGTLEQKILDYKKRNSCSSDFMIYKNIIKQNEIPGIMNQISPRIFEAIEAKTTLVLYEGAYSNIIEPNKHYLPLRKDGKNMAEVIKCLNDDQLIDQITTNAFKDIILSGKFNYQNFVRNIDKELQSIAKNDPTSHVTLAPPPTQIRRTPIKTDMNALTNSKKRKMTQLARLSLIRLYNFSYQLAPDTVRIFVRKLKHLFPKSKSLNLY